MSSSTEAPSAFSQQYHSARLQAAVSAALLLGLEVLGLQLPVKVSWIDVEKLGPEQLKLVAAVVIVYSLVRLCVEWAQTEERRKAFKSSRFEYYATLAFGVTSLVVYLFPKNTLQLLTQLPPWSTFLLSGYGLILGTTASAAVMSSTFIRTKTDALRLGLPRVPVVTRSAFMMLFVVSLVSIPIVLLAHQFESPLTQIWMYFVFGPLIILSTSEAWTAFFSRAKTEDGELFRKVRLRNLRRAVDQHDTLYQIGGWDRAAPVNYSPLTDATIAGDTSSVERLLDSGADPNEPNHLGWTALALAAAEGHLDVVEELIDVGADVNAKNFAGRTPLMFASRYGHEEIVKKLLDHGADPNVMPVQLEPNALMVASHFGHEGIVHLLLENGAKPHLKGLDDKTALEYAQSAGHGKVAAILRKSVG